VIRGLAKEVVGESRDSMPEDKQTRWWANNVKEIISMKNIIV